MRNLKKFLAMALTVLMVVGSFGMVSTANFDDVDEFQEAVNVMTDLGIACGYEDGTFGEDDTVERQQIVLWIAKMMTGKTDATYVANNFVDGVNYTEFVDVEDAEDLDVYTGAINYAANNGIIAGTTPTTFEPTESVMIQDVFAMVVRMLGYGSTAMNNNYPFSFIDKAISLGLDAGLGEEYIVDADATRGQTMQILYNALTVAKSDGSTLGYDYFNVEKATVVLTGTKALNAFTAAEKITKTVNDEDYVSFAFLNADGTVAGDANFYALRSEFGFDAETDVNILIGSSYDVLTNDGFQTFITCEQNTVEIVDQTAFEGTNTAGSTKVTIDGVEYKLVDAYSSFVNGGTMTTNDTEIIIYTAGTVAPSYYASSYVYDEYLNILDNKGEVLLQWKPTFGGEGYVMNGGVYLYQIPGTNTFVEPNEYIWSLAAKKAIGADASITGYAPVLDAQKFYSNNAYSTTVLFDDDNDGDWDRGIYMPFKFGKATVTSEYFDLNGDVKDAKAANITIYVDGEKAALADIQNQYIKYAYNPVIDTLFVAEIYTTQSAMITGIDWANGKVYFNGFGVNVLEGAVAPTAMSVGVDRFVGADKSSVAASAIGNYQELVGKKVNYILDGDKIVRILNAADAAGYMVVVNGNVGYTTMGYKNILAYYDAANSTTGINQSIVTVNANSSYWYAGYVNGVIANIDTYYEAGDLLVATKDALGNYDVAKVAADNAKYVEEAEKVTVTNGILAIDAKVDTAVKLDSAYLWIIKVDGRQNAGAEFYTFKGVPANTEFTVNTLFVDGKFIYATASEAPMFTASNTGATAWDNNDVVYVGTANAAAAAINNQQYYGLGVNFTPNYAYTNLFNLDDGSYFAANNNMAALTAKTFYKVVNGIVAGPAQASDLNVALLFEANNTDAWTYTALPISGKAAVVDGKYTVSLAARGLNEYGEAINGAESAIVTVNYAFPQLMVIEDSGNIYGGNVDVLKYASTTSTTVDDAYAALLNDVDGVEKALVVYYRGELDNDTIFLAASDDVVTVSYEAAAEKPYVESYVTADVEINFVRDAAETDKANIDAIVSAPAFLGKDGEWVTSDPDMTGKPKDGIKINDLGIEKTNGRKIRFAVKDTYVATVTYIKTGDLVDRTDIVVDVKTENVQDQVNYYEISLTQAMIDDGKIVINVELETK